MARKGILSDLLQDEQFLFGAGLLSAGSMGQNLGQAALPQLLRAANTANYFQKQQAQKDVADQISNMDMTGLSDIEKALLKLDPLKAYSSIMKSRQKPKKSVRQMTDVEKTELNIPTSDRVTATVDENDNITDYKITSASDDRIKNIRKAVTDSKINEADEALQAVEIEVSKLLQSGEKDLPGIGILGGNLPDFLTSKKGLKLRSLIQTYENIRLKKRSGSQVTPNELTRSQAELAGSIKTADESVFLDILRENRKVMEKQKKLAFAGFDDADVKSYQSQGGLQYFESPLLNMNLGEAVEDPLDPFAGMSDEQLEALRERFSN
tara:strand:+ start:370 stop:1338 length:969 start_codon:yes stop_codon:yes gene_type:complete